MLLIIGNKKYSSWSLRPWLALKHFEIPFEEKLIALDQKDTAHEIRRYSPAGRVPILIDGQTTIWESLAILEYLNDKYPEKKMWPQDLRERAWARSISNEMHAGFFEMRNHLSHDISKELPEFDLGPAKKDVQRVIDIWQECLSYSEGPFLFGDFTLADAMFAPVVNRFVSYAVKTEGPVHAYIQTMRELKAHRQWISEALSETLRVPKYEN